MPAFPLVDDTVAGCQILRRVGPESLGSVFEARQVELGRLVVLTFPSPEAVDDVALRRRFLREARALKNLDSPHVAKVFDAGRVNGMPFAVTELTSAPDLALLLHQFGPLPVETALNVVAQLASALDDMHGVGVVHRDVKPANVAISNPRTNPVASLGGFGLAVQAKPTAVLEDPDRATLEYLAPERHNGADATVASDIYSLGCVLWAALTGGPPYPRATPAQVADAHVHEDIPSYPDGSAAHSQLNELFKRAMGKEPSSRFSTAAQMHAAVMDVAASIREAPEDTVGLLLAKASTPIVPQPRRRPDAIMPPLGAPPVDAPQSGAPPVDAPQSGAPPVDAPQSEASPLDAPPTDAPPPDPTPLLLADPPRRPRRAHVLLALLVTGVLIGGVGVAAALLGGGDEPDAGGDNQPTSQRTRATGTTAKEVVCPNGGEAAPSMSECPMPAGSAELRLVFPSLDQTCTPADPNPKTDEVQAYNCDSGTSLVRYSRWEQQGDRYGYLDTTYPTATRSDWYVDNTFAGQTWTAHAEDIDPDLPDVWAATYRYSPFTVIVKAADAASRDAARERVEAADPFRVRRR